MIFKSSVFLTIVGVAVVSANEVEVRIPVMPRKINEHGHGWAYSLVSDSNSSFEHAGFTTFSWDLDQNCARQYTESNYDDSWSETMMCNKRALGYHTEYGCYLDEYVGYINLTNELDSWLSGLTINHTINMTMLQDAPVN